MCYFNWVNRPLVCKADFRCTAGTTLQYYLCISHAFGKILLITKSNYYFRLIQSTTIILNSNVNLLQNDRDLRTQCYIPYILILGYYNMIFS